MVDFRDSDELPLVEEQVRSLVARVAARGAVAPSSETAESVRHRVVGHHPDDLSPIRMDAHPDPAEHQSRGRRVRATRSFTVAAVLVVGALVTASVLIGSHARSAPPGQSASGPSWRLASLVGPATRAFTPTSGSTNSPFDITCPTVMVCYVGAQTLVTEAGATNGTDPTQPVQVATTTGAYVSTDAGTTWQPLTLPPGVNLDTKFTCPSASVCMVGSQVMNGGTINGNNDPQLLLRTSDGGATWSEEPVPLPPITGSDTALDPTLTGLYGTLNELTCFSATTCVGFGLVPSDQLEQPISLGSTVERSVFVRTADGGTTWTTYAFPWLANPDGSPGWSNAEAGSFACGSSESCVGFSTVLSATPNQVFSDATWRTSNGGTSWSQAWLPGVQPGFSANSISCTDALHCVSVHRVANTMTYTSVIEATSDGGATWTRGSIAGGAGAELLSVTCVGGEDCWLTGSRGSGNAFSTYHGIILESTDGGMTWSPDPLPAGIGSVDDISCPAATACFAVAGPSPASPTAQNYQEVLTNSATSKSP
jgi:photosystem II stability/assembly factor-like uncharacterized protein